MTRHSLFERMLERMNILPAAIDDVFASPLIGRILAIAVKRGVFEGLETGTGSLQDVATRVGLSLASVEKILNVLQATGYVNKRGETFGLTKRSKKWLVRSSPSFIGNFVEYVGLLHSHWLYLEDTLQDGVPPKTYFETFTPSEWEIYSSGMEDLARLLLPYVAPLISFDSAPRRLLDIGGSHGLYSTALCRRYPSLSATVVDFAPALERARRNVERANVSERVELCHGDIFTVSLPAKRYDAALMFNVVHGFNAAKNRELIGKVSHGLSDKGKLYLLDQWLEKGRGGGMSRVLPLLVGVHLLNEAGGDAYAPEQIVQWMEDSGFTNIRRRRLRMPGVSLIEGRKR